MTSILINEIHYMDNYKLKKAAAFYWNNMKLITSILYYALFTIV